MIHVLTILDMTEPAVMYEATRLPTEQWSLVKLEVGKTDASTETIPGEIIHTGTVDEVLSLVRRLMAPVKQVKCGGCGCEAVDCGPHLWVMSRKCCPDCEH